VSTESFRRLRAYSLSAEAADELHRQVAAWPAFERWTIGMQLVRAADSVGANIAEATGRWHPADKRRLLIIARGSLYEVEHWVLRAGARGLSCRPPAGLGELGRTLNGLIKRPTP